MKTSGPPKRPLTSEERDAALRALIERGRREPVLDDRTPDEILGYNELGVFDDYPQTPERSG